MKIFVVAGLAGLISVAAGPADAMSPEELQSCIWLCRDAAAGNEAVYGECVASHCRDGEATAAPADQAGASAWEAHRMDPADPPYIDGGTASAVSLDGTAELDFICGRNGDSWFRLAGRGPAALRAGSDGVLRLQLVVDGRSAFPMAFEDYEGDWVAGGRLGDPVIRAVQQGSTASLVAADGRTVARFGLRGSSKALATVRGLCSR